MIRIGIGISVKNNNIDQLDKLINSIEKYTSDVKYTLFCALNGVQTDIILYLLSKNIEFTYGPSIGLGENKNRIIRRFSEYNNFFILEDNVEIVKKDWIEQYLLASTYTGLPFIAYHSPINSNQNIANKEVIGNTIIINTKPIDTRVLFYSRKVIEKVGCFNNNYNMFEYEQYKRMTYTGLLPKNKFVPAIANISEYIKPSDDQYKDNRYKTEEEKYIDNPNNYQATIYQRL